MQNIDWTAGLSVAANLAQVLTGLAAVVAAGVYLSRRRHVQQELESFLQLMTGPGAPEQYAYGTRDIARILRCTEGEVMEAAYRSACIVRLSSKGEDLARLAHNGEEG